MAIAEPVSVVAKCKRAMSLTYFLGLTPGPTPPPPEWLNPMSDFIDADDKRILVQGALLCAILFVVVLGLAATAGLAWTVWV